VHVLVDDLGYADLGYKDPLLITPAIDALRHSGVELSSYYAWKYCNPSRAMLLTGRYMHNLGIYSNGGAPALNFTLLPDRLKQAAPGLRAVMIGKWHLGQSYRRYTPTYRGFDSWLGYYDGDEDYWKHTFPTNCKTGKGRCGGICAVDFNNNTGDHGELQVLGQPFQNKYSARVFGAEAVREIEKHGASDSIDSPFFLYLAMQSVHGPWEAPDESVMVFNNSAEPQHFIEDPKRQVYAGMLLELDYTVANVTAALKRSGMWHERTLFVLTSDNGGPGQGGSPPNNLPLRGGKATLWEGS
jgi:arylsulfatase A-like enzyme